MQSFFRKLVNDSAKFEIAFIISVKNELTDTHRVDKFVIKVRFCEWMKGRKKNKKSKRRSYTDNHDMKFQKKYQPLKSAYRTWSISFTLQNKLLLALMLTPSLVQLNYPVFLQQPKVFAPRTMHSPKHCSAKVLANIYVHTKKLINYNIMLQSIIQPADPIITSTE